MSRGTRPGRNKPAKPAKPASQRKATAREVAAAAGVSISAVSRTFTEGASVSPATRSKVLDASRSLGYQPNLLARGLMTRRTELIGLISNDFDNPAFMEIFDLFTRRLQQRGRRPLLVNLTDGAPPGGALEMLLQYSVDGVIVASSPLHRELAAACVAAETLAPSVKVRDTAEIDTPAAAATSRAVALRCEAGLPRNPGFAGLPRPDRVLRLMASRPRRCRPRHR